MAAPINANLVTIRRQNLFPWNWWTYKNAEGRRMWRLSCQFDIYVEIDKSVSPEECSRIEYRQFIRGGIWTTERGESWTTPANANHVIPIPPYRGNMLCSDLPQNEVDGVGLSLDWKEDGKGDQRYGYRHVPKVDFMREKDLWKPNQMEGRSYHCRDTPSIAGLWSYADDHSMNVWAELYFNGYVVEVERYDEGPALPIRVLKELSWKYLYLDEQPLTDITKAAESSPF